MSRKWVVIKTKFIDFLGSAPIGPWVVWILFLLPIILIIDFLDEQLFPNVDLVIVLVYILAISAVVRESRSDNPSKKEKALLTDDLIKIAEIFNKTNKNIYIEYFNPYESISTEIEGDLTMTILPSSEYKGLPINLIKRGLGKKYLTYDYSSMYICSESEQYELEAHLFNESSSSSINPLEIPLKNLLNLSFNDLRNMDLAVGEVGDAAIYNCETGMDKKSIRGDLIKFLEPVLKKNIGS